MLNKSVFICNDKFQLKIKYLVLLGFLLLYWYFGFRPFQLELPLSIETNKISHSLSDGIEFTGQGIGYTINPPEWIESAIAESKIDINLEFQTAEIDQHGPARILTISQDHHHRNLTIGQDGADLVLRIRTQLSTQNGYPPYRLKNVLKEEQWQQLHISITSGKLNVFLNNAEKVSNFLPSNPISQWSRIYKLAVGNEFTKDRPWQGKIRHAVFETGDQKIDYATKENLHFPRYLVFVNAGIKLVPFSENSYGPKKILDWIVNLLGFLPFGFFIIISTGRLTVFKAVALCVLLSLSIEIGQLFLVWRVTATDDLILNTLGGLMGTLIGLHYRRME